MRVKKYSLTLAILPILLLSLVTISVPAQAATPSVRIYVNQPLGYLPFQAPGTRFTFTIDIATSGLADGTTAGIIQWKMDIRVNPNVLDINTTVGTPPPFPPPYAAKFSAGPGHFLYEFAVNMMGYPAPSMFFGANDPLTGYQDEIAETGVPSYATGAGDYVSGLYPKLLTVEITSKNDTMPCLIDLIDVWYRTGDGVWHADAVVVDGYYGTPPPYTMSLVSPSLPPGSPVCTDWHELYPDYCKNWHLTSWEDGQATGDPGYGELSPSDQIDMTNETGWIYWFHVDAITTTIHWTFKDPETHDPIPGELGDAEPTEPHFLDEVMKSPIGSWWHQIYPTYSRWFQITSWEDGQAEGEPGYGEFSPSDQFDFEYLDEPGVVYWAHLDSVTTDIILSFKRKAPPIPEFPLGIEIIMVLALLTPLIYLWRRKGWKK